MSFLPEDERHADPLRREAEVRKALDDIQQFRSALAADRERVRSVVASEVYDTLEYHHNSGGQWVPMDFERLANAVATRAAEQLATAAAGLSIEDRDVLLRMRKSIQYSGEFTALLDRLLGATK